MCIRDRNDRIWLCYKDSIAWYDIRTGNTLHMPTPINSEIAAIEQTDDNLSLIHICVEVALPAVALTGGLRQVQVASVVQEGPFVEVPLVAARKDCLLYTSRCV